MKLKVLFASLCLACVLPMSAQFTSGGSSSAADIPSSFNRVTVGYKAVFPGGDLGKGAETLNGFLAEFNHGFGIGDKPMFVEVGGGLQYASSAGTGILSLIVPVNYSYWFNVADGISIAPYTGINFKANLYGSDNFFDMEGTKRFQMGWQIGVGANIKKFYVGLQYEIDFLPLWKIGSYSMTTSGFGVNVGYNF